VEGGRAVAETPPDNEFGGGRAPPAMVEGGEGLADGTVGFPAAGDDVEEVEGGAVAGGGGFGLAAFEATDGVVTGVTGFGWEGEEVVGGAGLNLGSGLVGSCVEDD